MITLKVEGMHCEGCVKRVTEGLAKAGMTASVSLEEKIVTIDGEESIREKAIEEIEDLGFEVIA